MATENRFEKVSWKQFLEDYQNCFGDEVTEEDIRQFYDNIELPTRATRGSAGYDFKSPITMRLESGTDLKFPTGIRAIIKDGEFLMLVPRSGLGTKHYMRLSNTIGIVDEDYSESDNEGHIFCKIRIENHNKDTLTIKQGEAFMQGIFVRFDTTFDDSVTQKRNGGFGSTTVNQK